MPGRAERILPRALKREPTLQPHSRFLFRKDQTCRSPADAATASWCDSPIPPADRASRQITASGPTCPLPRLRLTRGGERGERHNYRQRDQTRHMQYGSHVTSSLNSTDPMILGRLQLVARCKTASCSVKQPDLGQLVRAPTSTTREPRPRSDEPRRPSRPCRRESRPDGADTRAPFQLHMPWRSSGGHSGSPEMRGGGTRLGVRVSKQWRWTSRRPVSESSRLR